MEQVKKEIIIRLKSLENSPLFNNDLQMKQNTPQQKSLEKAQNLRKEGNLIYATCRSLKDFHNVYKFYAQSIAYAPANSEDMALAYSNLSAVLLRLEQHSECLQAIDCCLKFGYPEKSKFKVYLRKIECLKMVGETLKAKDAYVETLAWIEQNETDAEQKTEMKKKLEGCYKKSVKVKKPFTEEQYREVWKNFSIKKYSEEIPGASDAICLKYSEDQGRHFVATRDIRPGEIVMEDHRYLIVVSKDTRYQHCWMCGKFMANCIPCDTCNNVIFCSVECKEGAWNSYHSLECKLLSTLLDLPGESLSSKQFHSIILAAFRALFLAINEYGTLKNLRKVVEEVDQSSGTSPDPRTKGFTNGQLLHDKYLAFYSLTAHHTFDPENIGLIVATIFEGAATTTLFGKKFKHGSRLSDDEDVIFAACLVVKNLDILDVNAFESAPSPFDFTHTGMTLSILESLFNHSCVSNVRFNNNPKYEAGIAVFPIKKGEEVCVSYFDGRSIAEKQRLSRTKYRFTCNCIACKENWPSIFQYPSLEAKNLLKYNSIFAKVISTMPPNFDVQRALWLLNNLTTINFSDRKFMANCLKFYSKLMDKFVETKSLPCKEILTAQDIIVGLNNFLNNLIDVVD